MVFGAETYRLFGHFLATGGDASEVHDDWVARMLRLPATVVSSTLRGPLDSHDATVASGDAVDVVARLKQESDVPLRSHLELIESRMLDGRIQELTYQPTVHV